MSRIILRGAIAPVAYQDYHRFRMLVDQGVHPSHERSKHEGYITDLNLFTELRGLPKHAGVCDVGCGFGAGSNGLKKQKEFSRLDIYGINPDIPKPPKYGDKHIPIIQGTAENVTAAIAFAMAHHNLPQPQVLLYRNVLQNIALAANNHHGFDTVHISQMLQDSFVQAHNALPKGGKMLIYDTGQHGNFYATYKEIAKELGFSIREELCVPRRARGNHCNTYLAFTKDDE